MRSMRVTIRRPFRKLINYAENIQTLTLLRYYVNSSVHNKCSIILMCLFIEFTLLVCLYLCELTNIRTVNFFCECYNSSISVWHLRCNMFVYDVSGFKNSLRSANLKFDNIFLLQALKALAHVRLLKYNEAWVIINEVEQHQITDESTLQALTHCFKELAKRTFIAHWEHIILVASKCRVHEWEIYNSHKLNYENGMFSIILCFSWTDLPHVRISM